MNGSRRFTNNGGAPFPDAADLSATTMRRIWWRTIPLLGLAMVLNTLDRGNISFAALDMNESLGFSSHVFGIGISVFFIAYVLISLPGNLMLVRLGASRWLGIIALGWGAISVSTALVANPTHFYVNRFLLGLFEGSFQPGVLFYLTLWFPDRYRAAATASFMMTPVITGIFGSPLSASLLDVGGWGLAGWQWLFILEGLPSMLLGAAILSLLPDRPSGVTWLDREQQAALERALAGNAEPRTAAGGIAGLGTLRRADIQLLAAGYFFIGFAIWTLTFWLPQIIRLVTGSGHVQTGLLTALPYLVATPALLIVGRSSDRSGERLWHLSGTVLVGAAGFLLAGLGLSSSFTIAGLCLAAIGVFAFIGPFWSLLSARVPTESRAVIIAIVGLMGPLGGVVGPLITGWLREQTGSFSAAMLACSLAMAVAACCALLSKLPGQRRTPPLNA